MADRNTHWVSWNARVGVEYGLETYMQNLVTLRTHEDNAWEVTMSPNTARKLARALTKAAKLLDPPKPRKTRG